jgi:hypothetical protein
MADAVEAISCGGTDGFNWRVDYDGGESDLVWVEADSWGTILLDDCPNLKPNQECWPLIEDTVNPNHRCGQNVAFVPGSGAVGKYRIQIGMGTTDCDYQGTGPT